MLYNFLSVNKKLSLAAYKIQRNIKGLKCRIYRPLKNRSLFGLEDNRIEYDPTPITDKFLVFNLFQESFEGGFDFDPFIEDAYILSPPDERLELKSKVEVDFCGRVFHFIIDDKKNKTPNLEEPLFLRYILAPAT